MIKKIIAVCTSRDGLSVEIVLEAQNVGLVDFHICVLSYKKKTIELITNGTETVDFYVDHYDQVIEQLNYNNSGSLEPPLTYIEKLEHYLFMMGDVYVLHHLGVIEYSSDNNVELIN